MILLQKPTNDTGFSFPGGHVSFGETNEETLKREFKEEIDVNIGLRKPFSVGLVKRPYWIFKER